MTNKKAVPLMHITQVRSAIRRPERQNLCLKALGLGRIGKTVHLPDTPACRGLVRCVQHLVKLEGTT
ncbi:MAG: 50S ribosomal protein L30 [Holosporales bacterium]|jgi:large subunit ribosomal protein L30|nr:50S ribosomal protein L30 [Holosporales bacterium]